VKQYLNSFELEDLRHIISDRKSSKKLAHGPIIGGKRTGWGEQRVGNACPTKILNDKGHEFGANSYHNGQHVDLKDVLGNQFVKDSLIEKVMDTAVRDVNKDRDKDLDWRNNAYNKRSGAIGDRLAALNDHEESERVKMAHLMNKDVSESGSKLSYAKLKRLENNGSGLSKAKGGLPKIGSPNRRNFGEIVSLTEGSGSRFGNRRGSVPIR
jgi:hypothetical protein